MEVYSKTIAALFNPEEREVIYSVPYYQRPYMWTKDKWDSLFNDLIDNEPGHFIGSIISIDQSRDSGGRGNLELVDGQQRLATISLLLVAIYKLLEKCDLEHEDHKLAKYELGNLPFKLILKSSPDESRISLQNQSGNNDDYMATLKEADIVKNQKCVVKNYRNRSIYKAYQYFSKLLDDITRDYTNEEKIQEIVKLLGKVYQVSVVHIQVANTHDAYLLFESLNNRGMALNAVDLIKNKLLKESDKSDSPSRENELYYDQWVTLLNYIGEKHSIQERFFTQYYNAFRDDLVPIGKEPKATRSNFIKIYERIINKDPSAFLEKIVEGGEVYSKILNPEENEFDAIQQPLKDLERIQGTPSYVLILYLLIKHNDHKLCEGHLAQIISLIVKFFVRRNLTDIPPTRNLIKLFLSIIDSLKGQTSDEVTNSISLILKNNSASDDVFKSKLEGPIYRDSREVTRFILCSLEEQLSTRGSKEFMDLWGKKAGKWKWTIEHILPHKLPSSWVEMIANGDIEKAKDIQAKCVDCIGNLTITGYNSELGNSAFECKRDSKDDKGKLVGYKNGLALNDDLKDETSWGEKQIEARTKRLVELAIKRFSLE